MQSTATLTHFIHPHNTSGPHAEALLWADGGASDPCRHFYLQGCAFLGNVVTCSDYVWEEDEDEEEQPQGNGAAHAHGHHHISFEGAFLDHASVGRWPCRLPLA